MFTYNALLYTERQKRNLTRAQMARFLKINLFSYKMYENGYFKPSKRQVKKISAALDIDYSQYLEGELSYPAELPEKKKNPIVSFFYRVLGNIAFKITFIVLTAASLGFMVSGFVGERWMNNNVKSYYDPEFVSFVERLREDGSVHISIADKLTKPEYYIYEKEETDYFFSKYISITGYYEDSKFSSLSFTATYRTDNARLIYKITPNPLNGYRSYSVDARLTISSTAETIYATYTEVDGEYVTNGITYLGANGKKTYYSAGSDKFTTFNTILGADTKHFVSDFNQLLATKDPEFAPDREDKFSYLTQLLTSGNAKKYAPQMIFFLGKYLGIILTGVNLFIVIFAFIYGSKYGVEVNYRPAQLDVPVDEINRMKKDIRIAPFIPETLLEIVGIILVFIGSFRIVFYVAGFIMGNVSSTLGSSDITAHMQVFMVGMFLLYFIDFDIFLDDKRVFRNVFLYSIIFFCLYGLENLLFRTIEENYAIGDLIRRVPIPNMFGTIACYYLIMFFLFYTPKRIQRKVTLVLYRCCSIIPVLIIFTSWFLYNGYNVLFTADWPIELKNLFNGEKIPFSLLAVSYLFGLYFIRLFFIYKYGEERARVYFNGNKFLWIKNAFIALIIVIIGVVEIILKNDATAHKLGLGMYSNILFLIPLLFFYHPHKGPRNLLLDWTTLALYIIAIGFSYLIVIFMIALSL